MAASTSPGLSGQLLGVMPGTEVELALLAVDSRGRPRAVLSQVQLRGNGTPLPFNLPLVKADTAAGLSLELRGRASLSGQLVQRLPARPIATAAQPQDLGSLPLVTAP
ncbi:hypothetical protein [Pseudomonas sp. NCCP-436]|uniref:hypothetical protein n=1 Tax=Pseudomonas sp. NCCP-436 TaxID=2842481 RepID=UPI0021809011|nr:hypothetical protein [Pseudomonas sp. NCCP-436]